MITKSIEKNPSILSVPKLEKVFTFKCQFSNLI